MTVEGNLWVIRSNLKKGDDQKFKLQTGSKGMGLIQILFALVLRANLEPWDPKHYLHSVNNHRNLGGHFKLANAIEAIRSSMRVGVSLIHCLSPVPTIILDTGMYSINLCQINEAHFFILEIPSDTPDHILRVVG